MNPVETLAPGRTSGKPQPLRQSLSDDLSEGKLREKPLDRQVEALPLESTTG